VTLGRPAAGISPLHGRKRRRLPRCTTIALGFNNDHSASSATDPLVATCASSHGPYVFSLAPPLMIMGARVISFAYVMTSGGASPEGQLTKRMI